MSFKRRLQNFNWVTGTFIIGYHVGLLVGLPLYFYFAEPRLATILTAVALLFLTEIGIGAAYHRFYSHRCYSLSKPVEGVLLFLATLATQGSALQWSHDHRLHHKFVDSDDDPYSINKGFWYAHVLWLFEKSKPIEARRVPDLLRNRLVVLQHRYIGSLTIGSNLLVCALAGWLLDDLLGAFVLVWWTRLLLSHHLTWFINSLAHYWGSRTYSREQSAVDNYVLAILTVGEGYHNFHHTFPADYRNGIRWYHFDPTKWTIWTLSKLGLAGNLRRFDSFRIKHRLVSEDRRLLIDSLKARAGKARAELEQQVESLSQRIQSKLGRLSSLAVQAQRLKRERATRNRLRIVRRQLRDLRFSLQQDWKAWNRLCATML